MSKLHATPLRIPRLCGCEKADGTKCQRMTSNVGWCSACNDRFWEKQTHELMTRVQRIKEKTVPIKGLSDTLRLPRISKIHLGVKQVNASGKEFPRATDYFVFGEDSRADVQRICGTDKPNKLQILVPVEDENIWASQYYRAYSLTRGCICRGDGETASQVQDVGTHQIVSSPTAKTERVQIVCPGKECPIYQAKKCSEVMCLQFMLPDFPGIGVWQIDTGSINSIININSDVRLVRNLVGHIAMVPLTLSLEPQEVISPEDGKKKKVMCLHLRVSGSIGQLLQEARAPLARFLLPSPETGAVEGQPISVDDDGVMDEGVPVEEATKMFAGDPPKDPLTAWKGTSRPPAPVQTPPGESKGQGEAARPVDGAKEQPAQPGLPALKTRGELLTWANGAGYTMQQIFAFYGISKIESLTEDVNQARQRLIESGIKPARRKA